MFQKKCDLWSHYAAVALSAMIPISTTGTHIILLTLILLWFLAGSITVKTRIIFEHPITKVILLFLGLYGIGSLYSVGPLSDSLALCKKMSKLLYIPFLLPLFKDTLWRRAAFNAFIASMLLTLMLSFCKYYEWISLPLGLRHTDACVFKDHIDTNLLMAFTTFLLMHYGFNKTMQWWVRGILWCTVGLLTFYVWFMSEGRTGQVIYVALLLTFFIQRFRLKGILYGFICMSLLAGIVYVYSSNFQKRWAPEALTHSHWMPDASIRQRREFLEHTLMLAFKRPWFGFGTGSFKTVYAQHVREHLLDKTNNPHGEYLHIYFQLGLVGLLGILGFFGMLLKTSFELPLIERMFAQGLCVAPTISSTQ